MSSDWKKQYAKEIEEVWSQQCQGRGLCAICPICGGSSISFCRCAKQRFVDSLTPEKLLEYIASAVIEESKKEEKEEKKGSRTLQEKLEEILRKGKFYFRAMDHYAGDPDVDPYGFVICDSCTTREIKMCIGATVEGLKMDLCLRCADEISHKMV